MKLLLRLRKIKSSFEWLFAVEMTNGKKKVSSCLSSCSDLLPVHRRLKPDLSLGNCIKACSLFRLFFSHRVIGNEPKRNQIFTPRPHTTPFTNIIKFHSQSSKSIIFKDFSSFLCFVLSRGRLEIKGTPKRTTETIIFIHNPLRANDLFCEWKISWKSKRGNSGVFKDLFSQGCIFHRKVRTRVLSESVLWDFYSQELEDPIDTLTEPFIKRKINNKRMCTMKLENIKQTKSGND